ncbi:MAG: pantetheine-phosphate adenylyltransferase [Lachnospiraceae bacterium]|nr:pantetheine-phosphate adenylyltransferase [Lachnospiraceae bacterium]
MKKAVYPGSFDPVTLGHLDIIQRAASMFDELIVAVLNNNSKSPLFSVQERVNMLFEVTKDIPNVKVVSFSGLLVDFVEEIDAHIVVRGLRAITDFEYELQMSQTNRLLNSKVDTVFLNTNLKYSYLSSSMVREVAAFGGEITKFVPETIVSKVYDKYGVHKEIDDEQ